MDPITVGVSAASILPGAALTGGAPARHGKASEKIVVASFAVVTAVGT
jgi:hypothetical protein